MTNVDIEDEEVLAVLADVAEKLEDHILALAVLLAVAGEEHTARMIAHQVSEWSFDSVRGIATIALLELAKARIGVQA